MCFKSEIERSEPQSDPLDNKVTMKEHKEIK